MALEAQMPDSLVDSGLPLIHEAAWPERPSRSLGLRERQTILALGDSLLWTALISVLALFDVDNVDPVIAIPLCVALWLVVGYLAQIFRLGTAARIRSTVTGLLKTALVVDALLLLVSYMQPSLLGPYALAVLALLGPAAIGCWRLLSGRFIAGSKFERRVLIIGGGPRCLSLLEAIEANVGHGVRPVGIIDDGAWTPAISLFGIPVVGQVATIWDTVHNLKAEEVILALEGPADPRLSAEVAKCYEHAVVVSLMPRVYGEVAGQVPVEHMADDWLGAVPLTHTGGWLYDVMKRALDVTISGLTLALCAPLIPFIALGVRLASPGPIHFRQVRLGLHGRPFTLFKFRSMPVGSLDIPRMGRFLRRTHLDELPQLINVLRGDMSLVGPRPKRADEGRLLEQEIPLYRARQSVRPGLTGWAQIVYRYAHTPEDEMAKLRYDLYYVQHQSLVLDIVILVRTAASVLTGRGV